MTRNMHLLGATFKATAYGGGCLLFGRIAAVYGSLRAGVGDSPKVAGRAASKNAVDKAESSVCASADGWVERIEACIAKWR